MKHKIVITTIGGVVLSVDHKEQEGLGKIVPYLDELAKNKMWKLLCVNTFRDRDGFDKIQYTLSWY